MKKVVLTMLAAGLFTAASAQDKSLLYEVSGKGLAEPSYLYGTFHLLCPKDLQMTASTQKALSQAKQLYLELDMDDPSMMITMMRGMMLGEGKTLKTIMSAEDYAALDSFMKQTAGTGLAALDTAKPIMVLSMMYAGLMKCEPASHDLTFAAAAATDKKQIFGLESIEAQMAVIDKIPLDQQIRALVEIARKPEEARREFDQLLAAYKAQDVAAIMKLMDESQFDVEEGFEAELLDKRNANWVPVIEKAAREKSTFFAFGAGHLGGEKGVVALLRQAGYTVRPLP